MKIEVTSSTKKETVFPKLMVSAHGLVILMIDEQSGMRLKDVDNPDDNGDPYYGTSWERYELTDFEGSVTLAND